MTLEQQTNQIAELAKQSGRSVFLTAYRLLGDKPLAEDVTQEVFLKLFKKSPRAFDTIQNWPAYLKTMAASSALDILRKQKVRAEDPLESITPSQQPLANTDPESETATINQLHKLRELLGRLNQQEAQVFALRFFEEFSYQEIAEQLTISNSLVGVTLHRAQQKLANFMQSTDCQGVKYETRRA